MQEGIVESSISDEQIEEFIINDGYPIVVVPIVCVLSGSRGYGLDTAKSDRDYLGIHIMDTWECLEHPSFRTIPLVIRKGFNNDLEDIRGEYKSDISLDSFEMWKFIDLYLKGSFVSYEILYMPAMHLDPDAEGLLRLMRSGITNRIGRAARGNILHDWRKHKYNRKKTVMAYYRLCQALLFLREQEFEWRADVLLDYMTNLVEAGKDITNTYCNPILRSTPLSSKEFAYVPQEIDLLLNEVDRALITTRLPDRCPQKTLDEILMRVKKTRSIMI